MVRVLSKSGMVRLAESALTRVGARLSPDSVHYLNAGMNYVRVGNWIRANGFHGFPRLATRNDVFDAFGRGIADQRVLYLEFGVWEGQSIRYWSQLLRNPDSMLHGFDSFEGLPQAFTFKLGKGHFDTHQQIPDIDDPRVRFFAGWFRDTLPLYEWPEDYEQLVVMIDADLYSSTVEVLDFVEHRLRPGSFVYFDEFNDVNHELRAFEEFLERSGMHFSLVAATSELGGVAFCRVA